VGCVCVRRRVLAGRGGWRDGSSCSSALSLSLALDRSALSGRKEDGPVVAPRSHGARTKGLESRRGQRSPFWAAASLPRTCRPLHVDWTERGTEGIYEER
jgi:hypothetical protein